MNPHWTHACSAQVWTRPDFGLQLHRQGVEAVLLWIASHTSAVDELQEIAAKLHLHLYAPGPGLLWSEIQEEIDLVRSGKQEGMLVSLMSAENWSLKCVGARGAAVLAMDVRSKAWLTQFGAITWLLSMVRPLCLSSVAHALD